MTQPLILFQCVLLLAPHALLKTAAAAAAAANTNWQLPLYSSGDLERESSISHNQQLLPRSPVSIGQQIAQRSSHLFSRNNGRYPDQQILLSTLHDRDLFQCVDPTRGRYEEFVRQYNRTFQDSQDKLERYHLFQVTLKRAIMLNRIIQNEILNRTNYDVKPEIRNYHFIEPLNGDNNLALWYADITDCELGLLKHILFDIFHLIDKNELQIAYKFVLDQRSHLASLLSDDGFEQLAEILLVRLYDRFKGDKKMNQLFEWPMYLKKLAAFGYSQQQAMQPDFKTKLPLVAFAYPVYFKDLKYNYQAINRTNDNLQAHKEHELFNARLGRQFSNLKERNKRLVVFRQRWSLLNQLNDQMSAGAQNETSSRHLLPDWLRIQYPTATAVGEERDNYYEVSNGQTNPQGYRSERLIFDPTGQLSPGEGAYQNQADNLASNNGRPFKLTQFSDLTDAEFQAFLSNDFSVLEKSPDSIDFLDKNFPLRPLDSRLRWELAHELELRRGTALTSANLELLQRSGQLTAQPGAGGGGTNFAGQPSPSVRLAKQVIDELISEVGLPVGPVTLESIPEGEHVRTFQTVASFYQKPYLSNENVEERTRRFDQFKANYGRFRAWFAKEDWRLSEAQQVAMLRFADMSWREIKLSLFKLCCLTDDNIVSLGSLNSTLQYLGSNYRTMCVEMVPARADRRPTGQARTASEQQASELAALELYYYYSVHFNKHHLGNREDFQRRFYIFRRNIEAIRRHSCKRDLTLYESLKRDAPDSMNTIDVLDQRRSHTDDLNLDRFDYFSLPVGAPTVRDLAPAPPLARLTNGGSGADQFQSSRAGVSYRRDYFAQLIERQAQAPPYFEGQSYANRLQEEWQDANEYAQRYRENNVKSIYELVMARYRFCMKTLKGIDLDSSELRQQCRSDGLLGDQAAHLGPLEDYRDAQSQQQQQQQQQDQCGFYRQGLEPWAEGLIRQDSLSPQLIQSAKC